MLLHVLGAALIAIPPSGADSSARAVVAHALRAVEGDSAGVLEARWVKAVATDRTDSLSALGLATIARLTYRYADAERALTVLMPVDRGPSNTHGAGASSQGGVGVYAALGLAWGYDAQGFEARADSAFVRARLLARTTGDRAAETEALIGLSVNRASQQGISIGNTLLDTAALLAPRPALDLEADIAVRRALFATVLSHPDASARALAAAALAHRAGEPREEARALRALALGLELSGAYDSSAVVLARVEQIERRVHDRATLAETLMRHGDIFHNRGDIGPYKQFALAAQAEADASHNVYALASANVGLAAVALLLNDLVSASTYLDRATALYDMLQDESGRALVRTYRADLAVDAGQWGVARDLAEQARDFDHKIGDPAEFEEWRDLIAIDIRAGDLPAAERALAEAEGLSRARRQPRWYASLDVDRGRLALAEARPAAAGAAFARYLQTLDTAEHVMRYTARALLAETEAQQGLLDRAELEMMAAEDELDAWRGTLTDRALRPYVFQVGATEANDRDAATATVLAELAGQRPSVAFALAERRRARDLANRLVRLAALRDESVDTSSQAGAKPPGSLTRSGDVAARATAEQGDADSVAAVLPDGHTALVEYVTGAYGAPTTVFVVTQSQVGSPLGIRSAALRTYTAPSADSLAGPIERLVALLEGGDDAVSLSTTIAASILDVALRDVGAGVTHLIIVPDGPIYRVPFNALRTADGEPLAMKYSITIAPSAAVLRALWRRPRSPGGDQRPARLLALADPAFPVARAADAHASVDPYRDVADSLGGLERLGASAREAHLVARYASSAEVRLREAASASYLLHAPLNGYRIIHIATHALVDERSVARTALVLAAGDGESGFVTPTQLASLRLDADLVVLSGCRTAGGVVIDGDGIQGLTGPLLAAGARSVVATQWRVGDRAIVPIVDAFYDAMARGLPVGDALEAAKRDAIAHGARTADWAAFTVVGDPLARPPLRRPGPSVLTVGGWVVILLLLLAFVTAVMRGHGPEGSSISG